jgi:hypothetical protein
MRFWLSASVALLAAMAASAQTHSLAKRESPAPHRANELKLAQLRPGRDTLKRARKLNPEEPQKDPGEGGLHRIDVCQNIALALENDASGRIRSIRISRWPFNQSFSYLTDCIGPGTYPYKIRSDRWVTGHGLSIGDSSSKVEAVYGKPDSRSPSTKGGHQLELLHYTFDGAGPDVPQVMEVLCASEKDGKPGRVVEITLAAANH